MADRKTGCFGQEIPNGISGRIFQQNKRGQVQAAEGSLPYFLKAHGKLRLQIGDSQNKVVNRMNNVNGTKRNGGYINENQS